uniref:hypothetical protein n=1 Tax=Acetatifactor sp. TaxID=1872090 RepID=UPI0040577811
MKRSDMNSAQLENLDRINDIRKLEDNWNGYDSKAINDTVIAMAEEVIRSISYQPKLYPTGRDSIQMQYELNDRSYLEFEIFADKIVCMKVPQRVYSKAAFITIEGLDIALISKILKEFYEA